MRLPADSWPARVWRCVISANIANRPVTWQLLILAVVLASCRSDSPTTLSLTGTSTPTAVREAPAPSETPGDEQVDAYAAERAEMVKEGIIDWGIEDQAVIAAMGTVPRHEFVPDEFLSQAYDNHPLPIGYGQTISQPYIVALMTEALHVQPDHRVLEIGTGSGYQAAVLSQLARDVFTIESVRALGSEARQKLERLGCVNVHPRIGDGYAGWVDEAPFDGIVVTAAPEEIPAVLIDQMQNGGRLVIPVGAHHQELVVVDKEAKGIRKKKLADVRFVPMVRKKRSDR
jgi:protein-L-isoaspartate(D-aspartate) O-methyltransferase